MIRRVLLCTALAVGLLSAASAHAFTLGIIAFQMSSETHARVANAAAAAAKAKGWTVQILNSEGSLPKHAEQIEALIQAKVDGMIIAMGKPVEADAQLAAAKKAGIPVITTVAGTSPHTLFDIQVNDYQVGSQAALYLLGKINFRGEILACRYENNVASRIRGKILDVVLSENTAVKVLGSHSMARTQSWQQDVRNGMQALILQNRGKFQGIWASFDGQAYVIDDLLRAQGMKRGEVHLVSIDGGPETYRRIKDPDSLFTATVAIPFEKMGTSAVEAMDQIVVKKTPKEKVVSGPYMIVDAVLVDASNVDQMMK
ncbi:MAG TPA: substrate-binding domain-containing protein [Alphaproteobacteria bacterium]|nr:substrate-binding domain-containing protein [Alphaproteobacteria bacterium]